MSQSFDAIAELFGLSPAALQKAKERSGKVGETSSESRELGKASLADGRFEEAVEHYRRAVEQSEGGETDDAFASTVDLAGVYEYGDLFPQALRQYQTALKIAGEHAEPHVGISDVLRRYGRFQDSIDELKRAISLDPQNAFFHFKLSETLLEAGYAKEALLSAMQAVLNSPEDAFYHYWTGDLQIRLERFDEALESFKAAIELSPGDDLYLLRAAVAFWRAGKKTESIKSVRLASDLDPSNNLYYGLLEALYEANDQLAEAAMEKERASKMDAYDDDRLDRILSEMKIA